MASQLGARASARREKSCADAGGGAQDGISDGVWFGEYLYQRRAKLCHTLAVVSVMHDGGKLIATKTRDGVGFADEVREPLGYLLQRPSPAW
jgi:hypothetical protein